MSKSARVTEPSSQLSVCVLSWNSNQFLTKCLQSLRQHNPAAELIVLDNGSADQEQTANICVAFGVDKFIPKAYNVGVAAGRNEAVSAATRDYVCTLDVDTAVEAGALDSLVVTLASYPTVGLVAPRLLAFDGTLQHSCRLFPTAATKILRLVRFADRFGALAREELHDMPREHATVVDWVIGACQMYRRSDFQRLGGYTAFSAFGSEDIDFCVRVWEGGLKVVYVPSSIVHHFEQRVARNPFRLLTFAHLISLIRYFCRHRYLIRRETLYRRLPGHPRTAITLEDSAATVLRPDPLRYTTQ